MSNQLLNKEEEYKRLNAELEKKTATLVYEADQVLKANERHLFARQSTTNDTTSNNTAPNGRQEADEYEHLRRMMRSHTTATTNTDLANRVADADDDDEGGGQMTATGIMPQGASEMSSDAQLRFLKAKLKVTQEESERVQRLLAAKDDELAKLAARAKELDEERVRQLRISTTHQSQLDKCRRALDDEQAKSGQLDTTCKSLAKELDEERRTRRKRDADDKQLELKLNRALEEIERLKAALAKHESSGRVANERERGRVEQLVAENKRLVKQKQELCAAFGKQAKLVDVLRRQRVELERARVLQFSEDEFVRALDINSGEQPSITPASASNSARLRPTPPVSSSATRKRTPIVANKQPPVVTHKPFISTSANNNTIASQAENESDAGDNVDPIVDGNNYDFFFDENGK